MGERADMLEGLLSLDSYEPEVRRVVFRQAVTALSRAAPGQTPLEGCDEAALARSVQLALADGLFDDLGWLAASAAGAALYEIANALPQGPQRRELARLVLGEVYEGDAATFVAIATRMAVGGATRALAGPGIKTRVALAIGLPLATDVRVDPLALALVSRRELCAAWLGPNAVGSLAERRLAARILERAAREAADHARTGDTEAADLFRDVLAANADTYPAGTIERTWKLLFEDREGLVWRHVACARGLLVRATPGLAEEIRGGLSTRLSPTEWRRSATSLAASIAIDPDRSLRAALDLVASPLLKRDPLIATALVWGLGRAAEAEPEAAKQVLDALARAAPLVIAEDLVELRIELGNVGNVGNVADEACAVCATAVADVLAENQAEPDLVALLQRLRGELAFARPRGSAPDGATRADLLLRPSLERALDAFVELGSREAFARARIALEKAGEIVDMLEALHLDPNGVPDSARSRSAAVLLVRELDVLLLETGLLRNLLVLRAGPGETAASPAAEELDQRLAEWLLKSESVPLSAAPTSSAVTSHRRKLRALLHLIDGETIGLEDNADRRQRLQQLWTSTASRLFTRLAKERATPLRRAVAATIARALDALVRDGAADPGDALLYAAQRAATKEDLAVLAEASRDPQVSRLLEGYLAFMDAELVTMGSPVSSGNPVAPTRPVPQAPPGSRGAAVSAGVPQSRPGVPARTTGGVASVEGLVASLPLGGSQRVEALRSGLARLSRALGAVSAATSLRPLADPETSPLVSVSFALERLGELTAGALRRCGGEDEPIAVFPSPAYPLTTAVARALQEGALVGGDPQTGGGHAKPLDPAIGLAVQRAFAAIPKAIAAVVARVLPTIVRLPVDAATPDARLGGSLYPVPLATAAEGPMPPWMPSRRTLGGFYVQRQIGGGAAGSVFVVTRAEERHDATAERFALKVPDYDATAARSLSETDFLKMFREEAGALLALPENPNLARFVTFDAGARPKPILVMELVDGARCDKLIASRTLTMEQGLAILDGVLAGLEAMHAVGVGHLDVKPSNVLVREPTHATGAGARPLEAVLVDFGLAGRHLRPGCGTSSYGAPEVWVTLPGVTAPTPTAADIYSFGCFAFEVLTGETLFDAPNEVALVTAHLMHDGLPPRVKKLSERSATAGIASVLQSCLRKLPGARASAGAVRAELRKVGAAISGRRWPVPV